MDCKEEMEKLSRSTDQVNSSRNHVDLILASTKHCPLPTPGTRKTNRAARRRARRGTATRNTTYDKPMNTAEARREIATALKFHRSTAVKQPLITEATVPTVGPPKSTRKPETTDKGSEKEKCHACALGLGFHGSNEAKARTACGHYFCWVCLTKWLNFSAAKSSHGSSGSVRQCLVCSRSLMPNEVIPISDDPFGELPRTEVVPVLTPSSTDSSAPESLHPVMGQEELAEIRSVGEQHEIEWDDTVSLLTSLRWSFYYEEAHLNGKI